MLNGLGISVVAELYVFYNVSVYYKLSCIVMTFFTTTTAPTSAFSFERTLIRCSVIYSSMFCFFFFLMQTRLPLPESLSFAVALTACS